MSNETESQKRSEAYLGDGLYATYDGFMIMLRAPREAGDHYVGLEPEVFGELLKFALNIGWAFKFKDDSIITK